MGRLRTYQLIACARQLRQASPLCRNRPRDIVLHLGNLEDRQKLSLLDAIAYIHVDFLHVPGDFE